MKSKILKIFNPSFWVKACRSLSLSRKVTQATYPIPIRLADPFLKVFIKKQPEAEFIVNGKLSIESYQGGNEPVVFTLGKGSKFIIDGDFIIGNGTRIILDAGAYLYIGGRKVESASGITERSRIMVKKKVLIGADCIIAWNVFITDCDWHSIKGKAHQADVLIGEHVWVSANSSILKGSKIEDGAIIGGHSVVMNQTIPAYCLAAGNPAKVLREGVFWQRDMI